MLPAIDLLDKENWKTALVKMGPLLGIYDHNGRQYPIFTDIPQSDYPETPAMNQAEWQLIIDYYTASAPSELVTPATTPSSHKLPFTIQLPPQSLYRPANTASFIQVDTSVIPHRIFVNRSASSTLFVLNVHLAIIDSLVTGGPVVDLVRQGKDILTCKIGTDLLGNNSRLGSVQLFHLKNGKIEPQGRAISDMLKRPVQITSADLNGDLKNDLLVCEFGNMYGSLHWMENKGRGKYFRHDLRALPGATRAYVRDEDHDGLPDIWALFAQGEEGIFLFSNKGDGSFEQQQVLRFPPTYGSSYFELDDFNGDGYPDILYTCGDRGDGIRQLKPYHGVYIFINNGKNVFTQRYFYHVNGCVKAMAKDFDGDGDLDIAAIGFFTDIRNPGEGFTYLRNMGDQKFEPYTLPVAADFPRVLTMDIADTDGDGKPDIVLGNGFIGNETRDIKPLLVVLKNSQ